VLKKLIMICCLFFIQSSAFAFTAGELAEQCRVTQQKLPEKEAGEKAIKRFLDTGTCAGYVGGVIAGVNLAGAMMMEQKVMKTNFICMPRKYHAQQLVKMFLDYMDENKKYAKESAQLTVYNVFRKRFPCK